MLTKTWLPVGAGFFAFIAAHLVEAAAWRPWFRGDHVPWFLNSGRAVLFTAAVLFVVGVVAGARGERPLAQGSKVGAGGVAAMIVVFLTRDAGTIFPIVLAIGTSIVGAVSIAGAVAGGVLRSR
jgi:hypothetical protein